MGKKIVNLSVTKTGTYYMTVQLDESIKIEDFNRINFCNLVSRSTSDGEDEFESDWEVEHFPEITPDHILCLDESGEPYFKWRSK